MALIDRIKERTGTDLSDTELEAMIAGVTSEVEALVGPSGEIEVILGDVADEQRWRRTVMLPRPADAAEPVTVVELEPSDSGQAEAEVTLAASDFRLLHGGRTLRRLTGGPNAHAFWAPMIKVSYTPLGRQAAIDEVIIKLIHLDLSYRGGLKSERAGDYQFTLGTDPAQEREKLLASLVSGQRFVLA
jgi:hypothetical protein